MDVPLIPLQLSSEQYGERLSIAIDQDNQNEVESLFKLSGSAWKIEYLLSTDKLNANKQSTKGHALIHWAVRGNNPDILEVLLKDPRTHRDIKNKNGCTALSFAVAQGKVAATRILLDQEADPNIVNENGHTLLHSAIMCYFSMGSSYADNYLKIIKLLIIQPNILMNERDADKRTPLHYAVILKCKKVIKLLLGRNGIDLNIEDNTGKTASDYAREGGKNDLVELLLSYKKP